MVMKIDGLFETWDHLDDTNILLGEMDMVHRVDVDPETNYFVLRGEDGKVRTTKRGRRIFFETIRHAIIGIRYLEYPRKVKYSPACRRSNQGKIANTSYTNRAIPGSLRVFRFNSHKEYQESRDGEAKEEEA